MRENEDMTDNEALIEVYFWQKGGTSFNSQLFDLFQKADIGNQIRLSKGFPKLHKAWLAWCRSSDPEGLLDECIKNTIRV